jgi:C_GCAxxG_C_C family probable redox protein
MDRVSEAVELFKQGYACSQAILAVYADPARLDRDRALRLSAGFVAGMWRGETCGAVAGAVMLLGLNHYKDAQRPADARAEVEAKVADFTKAFRERNGGLACRKLLGCDLSAPEGRRTASERNLFGAVCVRLVRDAAEILETMAPRHDAGPPGAAPSQTPGEGGS